MAIPVGETVGLVIGGAAKVADILKTLSETLRQKNPDVAVARTQVSELQQATYDLQMENLGLQGQVGKLALEVGQMKVQLASNEEWKAHLISVGCLTPLVALD